MIEGNDGRRSEGGVTSVASEVGVYGDDSFVIELLVLVGACATAA